MAKHQAAVFSPSNTATAARLTVLGAPKGILPRVVEWTLFGDRIGDRHLDANAILRVRHLPHGLYGTGDRGFISWVRFPGYVVDLDTKQRYHIRVSKH